MLALTTSSSCRLWYYMEVPRTGSTTIDRHLRKVFPSAVAIYQKHWPCLPRPSTSLGSDGLSVISVRNPFSRAVSCWQFFTTPNTISFTEWLTDCRNRGFVDVNIEARPQAFWYDLKPDGWNYVIRQERLNDDLRDFVRGLGVTTGVPINRLNDINGPWVNRVRARTSRPQPWQSYYDETAKELVREVYRRDFESLIAYYSLDFPEL